MREGILVPDMFIGRVDIRFSSDDRYGGLHCGTTLEVWQKNRWVPTRIEMNGTDWYLVGIYCDTIFGLKVRI